MGHYLSCLSPDFIFRRGLILETAMRPPKYAIGTKWGTLCGISPALKAGESVILLKQFVFRSFASLAGSPSTATPSPWRFDFPRRPAVTPRAARFAFAPAAPETVRTRTGGGERWGMVPWLGRSAGGCACRIASVPLATPLSNRGRMPFGRRGCRRYLMTR